MLSLTKAYPVFTFPHFSPFSVPGSHSMFTHPFSLGSSRVWSFLRLCLFLISLVVWRRDWSGILQNVPQLGFVWWFSSWWNWAHGFGEGNHRDKGPFSSYHIKGTYYEQNFSLLMLTLITWLKVFVGPLDISSFPPFHIVLFGRKHILLCTAHS